MRATITAPGDPSVGIPSTAIVITNLPEPAEDGDTEKIEFIAGCLEKCFTEILDDEVHVDISEE